MQDVTIETVRSGDIGRGFADAIARERIPISGSIELLHPCNLKCVHCYCPEGRPRALTFEEIRRISSKLRAPGSPSGQ